MIVKQMADTTSAAMTGTSALNCRQQLDAERGRRRSRPRSSELEHVLDSA
jgi:hypothetical protein